MQIAKVFSWKSLTLFVVLLLTLSVGSCTQDWVPTPEPKFDTKNAYALSFRFSVLTPQTRATDTEAANKYDPLNENVINNMVLLMYENGNFLGMHTTQHGDLVLFPAGSTSTTDPAGKDKADAVEGIARLYVPKNTPTNPYQNKSLHMVVIANYHGNVDDLKSLNLTQLREKMADAANNLGNQDDPTAKQADFLMDASVNTGLLSWSTSDEIQLSSNIMLQRAAAKIRLRMLPLTNIKDDKGKPLTLVGAPQVALVNGVSNTRLLAAGSLDLSKRTYINSGQTSFQSLGSRQYDGQTFYARQTPFYVYANDWRNDVYTRTFLLVKLRLKDAANKEFDSFYNVPINYLVPPRNTPAAERDNYGRILRNSVYDITCDIQEAGSIDPENPTELNAGIAVEQWTTPKAIDGSIALAHYLLVKEPNPEMLAEKELDIQYLSDLPLDPSVLNQIKTAFTAYTQWGDEDPHTGTNQNGAIKVSTRERDGKHYIHVESPVPINYVPQTIDFTAQHIKVGAETPLRQHIKITQYPPIYVTAKKSKGNPIYWYSDFTFKFDQGYYIDEVTGETKYGPQGGGHQRNSTLYTVHVIAVPQDSSDPLLRDLIVGDPTMGATNQQTEKTEEANKIVSPEFMIASQWGLTIDIPQYDATGWVNASYYPGWLDGGSKDYYNLVEYSPLDENGQKRFPTDDYVMYTYYAYYNTYYQRTWRYRNYQVAADHALNYWEDEYGISETKPIHTRTYSGGYHYTNTTYRTLHFDHDAHWRIPSLAELKLINKIQKDPYSAVKALLFGTAYWSAQNNMAYSFKENRNLDITQPGVSRYYPIRPVFDTYKY